MSNKVKLRIPQIRVLQLLYNVGKLGGLSRTEIAKRLGTSGTLVGKTIGYTDSIKRAAFKLTKDGIAAGTPLLELEYIVEKIIDVEGAMETLLMITEKGVNAYDNLSVEDKRLPPTIDGWAKKKGRVMIDSEKEDSVIETTLNESELYSFEQILE